MSTHSSVTILYPRVEGLGGVSQHSVQATIGEPRVLGGNPLSSAEGMSFTSGQSFGNICPMEVTELELQLDVPVLQVDPSSDLGKRVDVGAFPA